MFADALTTGSLTDGPVLLVPSCGTAPDAVGDAVADLDPEQVLALGNYRRLRRVAHGEAGDRPATQPPHPGRGLTRQPDGGRRAR